MLYKTPNKKSISLITEDLRRMSSKVAFLLKTRQKAPNLLKHTTQLRFAEKNKKKQSLINKQINCNEDQYQFRQNQQIFEELSYCLRFNQIIKDKYDVKKKLWREMKKEQDNKQEVQQLKNKMQISRSELIRQVANEKRTVQKTFHGYIKEMNIVSQNIEKIEKYLCKMKQNNNKLVEEYQSKFIILEKKENQISQKNVEFVEIQQLVKNIEEEYNQVQKQQKLELQQLQQNKFQIMILRFQLLNQFRTAFHVEVNQVPYSQVFQYTAWKSEKIKKIQIIQIVYFIVSQLYPNIKNLQSKLAYQSQQYQILFKGIIEPKLMNDLMIRLPGPQIFESSKYKKDGSKKQNEIRNVLKKTKIIIGFAWSVKDIYNEFIEQVQRHLNKFNNQIIQITQVKVIPNIKYPQLSELKINYNYKSYPVSKNIYLLNFSNSPKIDIFQSIIDKRKKSQISQLLDQYTNGDKMGYLLCQIPLMSKTSDIKQFQQLYQFFKKDK